MDSILSKTNKEAKKFFLKEESYCSIELPQYFTFGKLLKKVNSEIGNKNLDSTLKTPKKDNYPTKFSEVNHTLLNNKDGRYSWRPLQLIHPVIYSALVSTICKKNNWDIITKKFDDFQKKSKINCLSVPIESTNKLSDKASSITNWWQNVEQKSLELALDYEYLMHTDISDCYGAIYTHSIPWALHGKEYAKDNRDNTLLGNMIDRHIQYMSYGQTNGIPQGSVLMDFIAEIILGYVDMQLSDRIDSLGINDYKILRYRDDFRVFTNNPEESRLITKTLSEIIISLGMRLNASKTSVSNEVIKNSIKEDKLEWISRLKYSRNLQKYLLNIHSFAEKYPNSGILIKVLDKFYKRIEKINILNDNVEVLISIVVDIGFKNPRAYPIVCAILSRLLQFTDKKETIINSIQRKFKKLPNTGFLELWLQRITLKLNYHISYDELLCKHVHNNAVGVWNSQWLKEDYTNLMSSIPIVDNNQITVLDSIIDIKEISIFEY